MLICEGLLWNFQEVSVVRSLRLRRHCGRLPSLTLPHHRTEAGLWRFECAEALRCMESIATLRADVLEGMGKYSGRVN